MVEHRFNARFRLGGTLPMSRVDVYNRTTKAEGGTDGFQLGDAGLYAVFTPWEILEPHEPDPFLSLHNLQLSAGLTFPTGDERAASLPALHFGQTGSGSIDPRFSAGYYGGFAKYFGAFLDGTLRLDGGADGSGFRNGPIYTVRLGATFAPHRIVSIGVANELVIREKNLQSGRLLSESGGIHDFIVPRVLLNPVAGLFVDASVGIPVWRHVYFQQPAAALYATVAVGWYF